MSKKSKVTVNAVKRALHQPDELVFGGVFVEVETQLAMAAMKGCASWCVDFRDFHLYGWEEQMPLDVLTEFANSAPSPFLQGYLLGVLLVRMTPAFRETEPLEIAAMALAAEDDSRRGGLLGRTFMAAVFAAEKPAVRSRRTSR